MRERQASPLPSFSVTLPQSRNHFESLIFLHGIFILLLFPSPVCSSFSLLPFKTHTPLPLPEFKITAPTRQKEIQFLCTDSLQTDGPITLACNKSQQGVALARRYPGSLCPRESEKVPSAELFSLVMRQLYMLVTAPWPQWELQPLWQENEVKVGVI